MYRGHRVGVVVPVYNEAAFVGDVIDGLPAYVDAVYPIDDCSTDGSWAVILERAVRAGADGFAHERAPDTVGDPPRDDPVPDPVPAARLGGPVEGDERTPTSDGGTDTGPRVVPIRHDTNRGRGGAVKTGYRAALEDGLDVVAVLDGDGQMDPTVLNRLLDPIVEGRADYTKGNRLLGRTDHGPMPRFRFVGNAILGGLTKISSGYWETGDPQTGYTAISDRALEAIQVDDIYEYYGYPNDVLAKLNVAEMRVVDVPIPINYGDEESDIRYHTYIPRVSTMLLRDFLWRLRAKYLVRRFHPLALLYGVGAAAAGVGSVSLARAVVSRVRGSDTVGEGGSAERGAPLTGAVLVAVGWVAMLLAMVFDLEENADRERRFER